MGKEIKVMFIGDSACGKTSILQTYATKSFPEKYTPTVFDTFQSIANLPTGECWNMGLWDTSGGVEMDQMRVLGYPGTNVFAICFCVMDPVSLQNVESKWAAEARSFDPSIPVLLVGTKIDLRSKDAEGGEKKWTTYQDGRSMATRIAALNYVECSSLTGEGLMTVMEEAISCYDSPTCRLWPEVVVPPDTMAEDLALVVNDATYADVEFVHDTRSGTNSGLRRVWYGHRILLSCGIAGEMFEKIFERKRRGDSLSGSKDSPMLSSNSSGSASPISSGSPISGAANAIANVSGGLQQIKTSLWKSKNKQQKIKERSQSVSELPKTKVNAQEKSTSRSPSHKRRGDASPETSLSSGSQRDIGKSSLMEDESQDNNNDNNTTSKSKDEKEGKKKKKKKEHSTGERRNSLQENESEGKKSPAAEDLATEPVRPPTPGFDKSRKAHMMMAMKRLDNSNKKGKLCSLNLSRSHDDARGPELSPRKGDPEEKKKGPEEKDSKHELEVEHVEQGDKSKSPKPPVKKKKDEWRNIISDVHGDEETGSYIIQLDTAIITAQEFQSLLYFFYTGSYKNAWTTGKGREAHARRTEDAEQLCKWLQQLEITHTSDIVKTYSVNSQSARGWGKEEVEDFHSAVAAIAKKVMQRNLQSKAFNNRSLSDVTFLVDNDRRLYAHKAILAARSTFLNNFLSNEDTDIISVQDNEALLPSIKRQSVHNFLELVYYLYTSDYTRNKKGTPLSLFSKGTKASPATITSLEPIFGLISLCNDYGLSRLAVICEHSISGDLQLNNVYYVLENAESHQAHHLVEYCVWFIASRTLTGTATIETTGEEKELCNTDLYQRYKGKIEEVKSLFKHYPHNIVIPQLTQPKKAS